MWYFDAVKQHPQAASRIRFEIVTNQPCSDSLRKAQVSAIRRTAESGWTR